MLLQENSLTFVALGEPNNVCNAETQANSNNKKFGSSVAEILVPQSVAVEEGTYVPVAVEEDERRMPFGGYGFQSKIAMAAPFPTTAATHQRVLLIHQSVERQSPCLHLTQSDQITANYDVASTIRKNIEQTAVEPVP
ncbi:hypothetical protein GUJ93_ZPchr0001g31401 [Zizania palustris]|uniref:Uncharacterized protein n=1 Tax=Zizania palustris TaxID=103762 RepID=A0A8J5R695_ZIZPA|nr:hypothetical protein GUJ93_ZPchr0001g31401 [Zizania palustris]